MDLGKKLGDNISSAVLRVKQYTQEVLGTFERTEVDKSFEDNVKKCEKTKIWTEKILARVEAVVQPNPSARSEELLPEKGSFDVLSQEFIDAGSDLGKEMPYGAALLKTGESYQKIGKVEKEYKRTILLQYVYPLRRFLENDFKAIDKERKQLEKKRLDLDACKGKLKKAKTAENQAQAEMELRIAQTEYERQLENTRQLLEGVNATHASQLRCLQYFVDFHCQYYDQCHQYMADLQRQLNKLTVPQEETEIKHYSKLTTAAKEQNEEFIMGISVNTTEVMGGFSTTDIEGTLSKDQKRQQTPSTYGSKINQKDGII